MQGLKKFSDTLNVIIRILTIAAFSLMVVVTFMQIIYRFVLLKPIPWSEELARYLFVWITFLGSGVAVKNKGHVGVELVIDRLPKKLRKISLIIAFIVCVVFCILMVTNGVTMVQRTMNQRSAAMSMPMSYAYIAIPIGFILMAMNFLVHIFQLMRGEEEEQDDLEELLSKE